MAVEFGQKYTVRTVGKNNFSLKCKNGKNSPLNRLEFVDVNVFENPDKKDK
jgi:hypothetical protein